MSQASLNTNNHDDEKEISSQYSNGARLVGIIFLLGVLLTVFTIGCILLGRIEDSRHLLLPKLIITGERHYTSNDDIRQSMLALGPLGTFITQDVNIIQNQIERISWIKQASVSKQWPDKLKIHLVEYVPIAHWNDQHMIDVDGNSFIVPNDQNSQQDLPKLYGPEGSNNEVLHNFREMVQMLDKNQIKLKDVTMTDHHSWQLTLNNEIKLNLGRSDIMNRLSHFVELYPILEQQQAETDDKRISYIDLRYNSGAAVGWKSALSEKPNKS